MIKIRLRELLAGRSLYWLSIESGVRWSTIKALASNKARRLDVNALNAVCEALDCQPGDLLVRVDRRKSRKK